eukprot:1754287-Amphidinium_carterae.1
MPRIPPAKEEFVRLIGSVTTWVFLLSQAILLATGGCLRLDGRTRGKSYCGLPLAMVPHKTLVRHDSASTFPLSSSSHVASNGSVFQSQVEWN